MATILDKDLIRESTAKFDNREIIVTLTADQRISFKLKGLKSGTVSIDIAEIFNQLKGVTAEAPEPLIKVSQKTHVPKADNPMISLYALRTENLVGNLDYPSKLILEKLICELLNRDVKL